MEIQVGVKLIQLQLQVVLPIVPYILSPELVFQKFQFHQQLQHGQIPAQYMIFKSDIAKPVQLHGLF